MKCIRKVWVIMVSEEDESWSVKCVCRELQKATWIATGLESEGLQVMAIETDLV
mgnify:CR=1 FL=1